MRPPSFSRFGRRALALVQQRNVAAGVAVALVSTMVVVAAVRADGAKATNVQLDDGAVWVSNQTGMLIGRLNIRVDELDLAVNAGPQADVLQQGRDVTFTGDTEGVRKMDVVSGDPSGKNTVAFPQYQMNGGIATVFDPATGKLWVGPSESLVGTDFPKKPDALLEPGSRVVLTTAVGDSPLGKVLVVSPTGWYELALDESFKPVREPKPEPEATDGSVATTTTVAVTIPDGTVPDADPDEIKAPSVEPLKHEFDDTTTVVAVGERLVFLKADGSLFSTDGDVAQIPGESPVLQQAGPKSGKVLVASTAGLFEVSIGGSSVKRLAESTGAPAQPVRVGPCLYGAWSGAEPSWFKACDGDVVVPVSPIPTAKQDSVLVYRFNQRNVAINSIGDGGVWADHDGKLAFVGNWNDAKADELKLDDGTTSAAKRQADKQCAYDGSDAPVSHDDLLGMRPRQSIIDVLYNDEDANCEPLAIVADSVTPSVAEWGQLTVVDNAQHIMLTPSQSLLDEAATGRATVSFTYLVQDSTDHTSTTPAQVTLSVYDVSVQNAEPELRSKSATTKREMRAEVEEGKTISYDVTGDWWDPDGDEMLLTGAVPERGQATSTPDGIVRYSANGVTAGPQNIAVTMTDGVASATEQFEVTVKPSGSPIKPATSNDFITLVKGTTGTLYPLANDSDANEDDLTLVPGWSNEATGYRVNTVQGGGALEVTGLEAGVFALKYDAADNDASSPGIIRLVVLEPDDTNHAPIAVPDKVKLRPDRVINVDVLANDIDPDGDVLAITAVQGPESTPDGTVRATIVDRRLVQIEVVPGETGATPVGPFFVSYTLSDGHSNERAQTAERADKDAEARSANGVITVTIVPATIDQAPVLGADDVVVRTGDVVSVPVLLNDADPDGDPLALTGLVMEGALPLEAAGSLVPWVAGRSVFVKGGTPGSYPLQYVVVANGKEATGQMTIRVTAPPDLGTNKNNPPEPKPLVLRAVRNAKVRLQVPTFGIDRDGDSIALRPTFGDLQGAAAGNVVEVDPKDPTVILFTAGPNSGSTDGFTYSVRDPFNAVGSATVTVVVLDNAGWPPQAHDDVLRAKPGRVLTIPLLANDTSPLDSQLKLAEEPFLDANGEASAEPVHPAAVKVLDQSNPTFYGRVEVTVPSDGSTLSEQYRIEDEVGNSSKASLRVTPDPNAPNMPPIAASYVRAAAELVGLTAVTVDVLEKSFDPDDTKPLLVEMPVGQNGTAAGGLVTIPLTAEPQIVLYRLSDGEDSTIGIIRVDGQKNNPPVLTDVGKDPTARPVPANATEPITILLSDIVKDPEGVADVLLTETEVSVVGGQGTVERLAGNDGFTYLPPGTAQQPIQVTIQFEVTDRPTKSIEEQQDPTCNCVAPLAVVVSVTASSAPRVVSEGAASVPQYNEEVVVDLAPLVVDDQNDILDFELLNASAGGLQITKDGSKITIVSQRKAPDLIPIGTSIPIEFTVSDGNFEPVKNTVRVTIIRTNKGQPAAASFPEQNAERDTSYQLPPLVNSAINPFASSNDPLTLLNPSSDPFATVTCTPTGDCQFMSTTVGRFRITYTLKDVVDQTAQGTITVLVKGKPRAPGVPRIESVGDHVVDLSWTAADMQGGAFTTYWVTEDVTGRKMQFANTGGQFTGLTNSTTYHFTVLAENEMGMGETSLPSSPAIPDRVPDPPINPVFTDYGNAQLFLSWAPPATAGDFSAIKQYQISIGGQTLTTTGATTITAAALQNGTDYTFRVRAQNSATTNGGWGEWSILSAPERPSRYPDPPTNVKAVNSGDGGNPRLTVTWNAPLNNGGRPITSYKVCVVGTTNCQTTGVLTAPFAATRSQSLSFTVIAYNNDVHKNDSVASIASTPTTAIGIPNPPTISSVTSGDHSLVVTAASTNGSGCSTYSLEYALNGGAWQSSNTFTGLTNGNPYSVTAHAILPSTCGTPVSSYTSASSSPSSQTPYGPLVTPTMSVSGPSTSITWTYSATKTDDGHANWSWSLSGNCSGSGSSSVATTQTINVAAGTGPYSCSITVSANGIASKSAGPASQSAPAPPAVLSLSTQTVGGNRWINGSGSGYPPNTQYFITCSTSSGAVFANTETNNPVTFATRTTDGSGNLSFGYNSSTGKGICFNSATTTVRVYTNSPAASDTKSI